MANDKYNIPNALQKVVNDGMAKGLAPDEIDKDIVDWCRENLLKGDADGE